MCGPRIEPSQGLNLSFYFISNEGLFWTGANFTRERLDMMRKIKEINANAYIVTPRRDLKEALDKGEYHLAVLLTSIHIERILTNKLKTYFKPKDISKIIDNPTLSRLIDYTSKYNLINEETRSNLNKLNKLRNRIVHNIHLWYEMDDQTKEEVKTITGKASELFASP